MYFRPKHNTEERLTCARARPYNFEPNLSINGTRLKKVDKTKFLGVIIDDKLSWDDHIDYLCTKLNSCIVMIKRICKFIPKSQYVSIYNSLFVSHLTYCISVWGGAAPSKLQKIFPIQKRCARILFGEHLTFDHAAYYETCARARSYMEHIAPKNYALEHTKPIFNKYDLLSFRNLYCYHTFMESFKIFKNHRPISLFSLFRESFSSRKHLSLVPPKFHLDISKNNFVCKATAIWNLCLPKVFEKPIFDTDKQLIIPGSNPNSDLATSVGCMKNILKRHLLSVQKTGCLEEWCDSNFLM